MGAGVHMPVVNGNTGEFYPMTTDEVERCHAVAAEAAAQQDRFEDMYVRLFETQAEWGEAQESRADLFRGFAEEIGLDMAAYDAAVADPATTERVELDFEEGQALGVSSTPTFFLDGELLELQEGLVDEQVEAVVLELHHGTDHEVVHPVPWQLAPAPGLDPVEVRPRVPGRRRLGRGCLRFARYRFTGCCRYILFLLPFPFYFYW